uniref:Selenoprotein P N-terminal domain-containing protein n=1 Tax=Myripristis murdjan TaxID=586833 RepID=A0A667X1J1_9TELE
MIVNEREPLSRAMYWELKRRAPPGIPVYQQAPLQDDVWEVLDGDKDDFLVYDRCGLLTFHIVLPYSFLYYPYVEAAIRATYMKDICQCVSKHTHTHTHTHECCENKLKNTDAPPTGPHDSHHHHHHHPHHNHHHHHAVHHQAVDPSQNQTLHHHHHDHHSYPHQHRHHPVNTQGAG